MLTQEKMFRSMTERLFSFCQGSFGITDFGGGNSPALLTQRRVYPIRQMHLSIADQNGEVLLHGTELPPEHRLLLDNCGDDPAFARLSLTQGAHNLIFASGDGSPIRGSVLVNAGVEEAGQSLSVVAINALFGIEANRQVSSIPSGTHRTS